MYEAFHSSHIITHELQIVWKDQITIIDYFYIYWVGEMVSVRKRLCAQRENSFDFSLKRDCGKHIKFSFLNRSNANIFKTSFRENSGKLLMRELPFPNNLLL